MFAIPSYVTGARAGHDTGRHDGTGARHDAGARRNRAVDRAHERDRGDRHRRRGRHHPNRGAAAAPAGARRTGRFHVSARSWRPRQLHHRRQHLHQCRRQPGDPLRHDPRSRARARSRAGGRHHPQGGAQIHQEQHRHRSEAIVRRHRGHARRGHPRRAADFPGAGGAAGGAVRAAQLRHGPRVARRWRAPGLAATSPRSR